MGTTISTSFNVKLGTSKSAGTFPYFWGNSSPTAAIRFVKSADIDGDGAEEVIFAAFESQPNTPEKYTNTQIQIFGWEGNNLKNMTSAWLPNNSNRVEGVGDIQFGDFNADGLLDVFLPGYADMDYQVHAYALMNKGGYFEKSDLGVCSWQHGSYAYDVNHDGYTDVLATGYGTDAFRLYLGGSGGLTSYKFDTGDWAGGSGVAIGDFFGDGTTSVILVDWGGANNAVSDAQDTALFKLSLGADGQSPELTFTNALPLPRLELPNYENLANGQYDNSHDIRALPMEFSGDSLTDVIVFSRGGWNGTTWPNKSQIQFLKNTGDGHFDDVTETTLAGFVEDAATSYSAQVLDVNNDGLLDIFSNEANWASQNSTFILMRDTSGKFTDSGRTVLSLSQPKVSASALAKGPDGKYYLVSDTNGYVTGAVKYSAISVTSTTTLTGTPDDDLIPVTTPRSKVYGLGGSDIFEFTSLVSLGTTKKQRLWQWISKSMKGTSWIWPACLTRQMPCLNGFQLLPP